MTLKLTRSNILSPVALLALALVGLLFLLPTKSVSAAGGGSVTKGDCKLRDKSVEGSEFHYKLSITIPSNDSKLNNNKDKLWVQVKKSGDVFKHRRISDDEFKNKLIPLDRGDHTTGSAIYNIKIGWDEHFGTYSVNKSCTVNAGTPGSTTPPAGGNGGDEDTKPPAPTDGAGDDSDDDDEYVGPMYNAWGDAERNKKEAKQLELINKLLKKGYDSVAAAVDDLNPGYTFAGIEQWRRNLTGKTVKETDADMHLLNVSMVGATTNGGDHNNSFRQLFNYLFNAPPEKALEIVSRRSKLVPSWAPAVYTEIRGKGLPWEVDLLASPGIDLSGSTPLFPSNASPISLFSFGVLQIGERTMLRQASAPEVMSVLYPLYRQHHYNSAWRSPDNPYFLAGLTIGGAVNDDCSKYNPQVEPGSSAANGCINGKRYFFSPVRYTNIYKRYMANGGATLTTPGTGNTPSADNDDGEDEDSDAITSRPVLARLDPGGAGGDSNGDTGASESKLKCTIAESSYVAPNGGSFTFTFKLKVDWSESRAAKRNVNYVSVQLASADPVGSVNKLGKVTQLNMSAGSDYAILPNQTVTVSNYNKATISYNVTVQTILNKGKKNEKVNYSSGFKKSDCSVTAAKKEKDPPKEVKPGGYGAPSSGSTGPTNTPGNPSYTGSRVCGGGTGNTNAAQIWSFLVNKGLSQKQAAGVLGNVHQESLCDPTENYIEPSDGQPSYGIAQWHLDRLTSLTNYASSRNQPRYSLQVQLDFLHKEANQRGDWRGIKLQPNENAAVKYWMSNYERCNPVYCAEGIRQAAADWALRQFGN